MKVKTWTNKCTMCCHLDDCEQGTIPKGVAHPILVDDDGVRHFCSNDCLNEWAEYLSSAPSVCEILTDFDRWQRGL